MAVHVMPEQQPAAVVVQQEEEEKPQVCLIAYTIQERLIQTFAHVRAYERSTQARRRLSSDK